MGSDPPDGAPSVEQIRRSGSGRLSTGLPGDPSTVRKPRTDSVPAESPPELAEIHAEILFGQVQLLIQGDRPCVAADDPGHGDAAFQGHALALLIPAVVGHQPQLHQLIHGPADPAHRHVQKAGPGAGQVRQPLRPVGVVGLQKQMEPQDLGIQADPDVIVKSPEGPHLVDEGAPGRTPGPGCRTISCHGSTPFPPPRTTPPPRRPGTHHTPPPGRPGR